MLPDGGSVWRMAFDGLSEINKSRHSSVKDRFNQQCASTIGGKTELRAELAGHLKGRMKGV